MIDLDALERELDMTTNQEVERANSVETVAALIAELRTRRQSSIYVLCCWGGDHGTAEPFITIWSSAAAAREFYHKLDPVADPEEDRYFIEEHEVDQHTYKFVERGGDPWGLNT